ncbi:DUF2142 domain-containing protein [Caballeronia sp. GAWG1-1]|uniref:DUF2142 domain-containing protein n=1 Tax=Caballeronia sp. GAWG1-1 TaxID=2921742 RepID=UPI002027A627|nr:DUF2142 domain-containing protein [Caballeronia sp. GAWG1-1]
MQSIKTLFAAFERLPLWKVYVFFAMPIGLFLVFATPPFQTPDAANHFYRAIQISEGQWRAYRFDGTSGGQIDANAVKFAVTYEPMEARADIKASRAMADAIAPLQWNGELVNTGFPNTAIYPVFAYLPQALAVVAGRALHMTVVNTYKLTCLVGLLVSMLITATSLGVARRSARFILFVALLPTTLMISASVSQEVVMIPLCFLVIAHFERFVALQQAFQGRWRWIFGAAVAVCASARPPYGALVLLLFYPGMCVSTDGTYRFWTRFVVAVATGAASLIAMKVFQSPAWTPAAPPRSVPGQLDFLVHHPAAVFKIAFDTMHANASFYRDSFIGVLGWLDAPLAGTFYSTASVAGVVALIAGSLDRDPLDRGSNTMRLMLIVPMFVGFALTFAALYLTWTPVGQMVVEGVQGRYLTALVPLLALAMPKLVATKGREWKGMVITRQLLTVIVLALPFFTFEQIVTTIINRFYLQ